MSSRRWIGILGLVALSGCAAETVESPSPEDALYRAPRVEDFEANQPLLDRVTSSPYGYFRFVNLPFAAAVCERMPEAIAVLPTVNLHGDAHLEQYAITNVGHGLSDFDDSAAGPAVLDLVRFSASVHLACRLRGWESEAPALVERFLEGYELALQNPTARATVPGFVDRVLAGFPRTRLPFLTFVESILEPLDEVGQELMAESFPRYVSMMLEHGPHLSTGFFEVVSLGRVRIGVGSALDRKYLVRVEGGSDAPDDDVVLEIREVRDLGRIPCIQAGEGQSAFRVLLGYSRIGNVPLDFVGPLPPAEGDALGLAQYWVHAWQAHYHELDVAEDEITVSDLREIVFDAGVQLGRGHTAEIGDPLRFALRRIQRVRMGGCRDDVLRLGEEMADETVDAWRRFRREAESLGLTVAPGKL